jgi:hypothetical protein
MQILQGRARTEQQCLSSRCQGDRSTRTCEEPSAKLKFKTGNLLAQGWLGDVEAIGGAGEMQLLRQHDKRLE